MKLDAGHRFDQALAVAGLGAQGAEASREGVAVNAIEAVVQQQLDAYNARDLARFVAAYSQDVRLYRPPANEPFAVGKAALAELYATQRFNLPGLRAELVKRMVLGNKVIDHERGSGVREQPFEVAAVYEVIDELITTAWFFSGD